MPATSPRPAARPSAAPLPSDLPGPPPERLWLPALLRMGRDPLVFFEKLREFGDLVHCRIGPRDLYLVADPELIRQVLVADAPRLHKDQGVRATKLLLGEGLLGSEGEFHRRQRRLSQPSFHAARLAGYAETMIARALRARDALVPGRELDLNAMLMELTLGIAGETLFGVDVVRDAPVVREALDVAMELFTMARIPFAHLLDKLPLPSTRRFHRARRDLDRLLYRIIEERRREGRDRGDLLSMLLLAQDEEAGSGRMTDRQLRDEVVTLLLAGHETTSNALAWTFWCLSQEPAVEARLHAHLDEVLGGRPPRPGDARRLDLCERVLAESMRLYPPAWIVARKVIEPVALRGHRIAPGAGLLMPQWVVHRDPALWPDPLRFDPDRFLPEAKAARPRFAYFPFGGGPRVCIGEGFAWMEGTLVLAALAQRFRFVPTADQRTVPQPRVTLRLLHGLRVTAQLRSGG